MKILANGTARTQTNRIVGLFAALVLTLSASFTTTQAVAQQPVVTEQVSREQVVEILGTRYGETPVARGLTETGSMMEVFATADGGTWTIVMTNPQGVSRVASTGVAWQDVRPPIGRLSNYAMSN